MKRYYVNYYKDFGNTYDLYWAETPEQIEMAEKKCERITRKKAERLCAEENYRRKHDQSFSGYASTEILPIDYTSNVNHNWDGDWQNDRKMYKDGYIVLYKK